MIHVWGLAARQGARVDIRIEDHDRQRCRPEYQVDLRTDLEWLGLMPTNGGRWSVQSQQESRYSAALERLRQQGLIYACRCSRKAIETAPGASEGLYPGHCRELELAESDETSLRVRLPDQSIEFHDARHGWQEQCPSRQCGDFVVRDRHGNWTYQFAVVVDDLEDEIDWIIRGDDLLASTGRQLLLASLLGRTQPISFYHHPLILNPDGTKLSKSEAAAPVGQLRDEGVSAGEVLARAVRLCGLKTPTNSLAVANLAALFESTEHSVTSAVPFEFVRS
jgi:glutamyl-tRNA synthetase/glutamyl-Q tRNA(Asp) synthetase